MEMHSSVDQYACRNTYKMVKMQTELSAFSLQTELSVSTWQGQTVCPCHVETEITVPAKLSVYILQHLLIKQDLLMFTNSLWAIRTFEFLKNITGFVPTSFLLLISFDFCFPRPIFSVILKIENCLFHTKQMLTQQALSECFLRHMHLQFGQSVCNS